MYIYNTTQYETNNEVMCTSTKRQIRYIKYTFRNS